MCAAYSSQADDFRSNAFQARIDKVRDRIDIADVIGGVVALRSGNKPRGKCPFHGSKSDSLAVDSDRGRARCWGCGWSGDAIKFVQDHFGLTFVEALSRLEGDNGIDGLSAAPVRREKRPHQRAQRAVVDSIVMGRWIWKHSRPANDVVRGYLTARGVPASMLGDHRLADLRFISSAPIVAWPEDKKPGSVPQAPAIVALVRHWDGWRPIGVHVTFLSPDLLSKMDRPRQDGSTYPARKMLGDMTGGCVVFPGAGQSPEQLEPSVALYEGEGLETVLSGMALAGAADTACGLAALSLDNMQGHPKLIKGALPLYDPRPDPDRAQAVCFPHDGPVTGLIDADMKPLRGLRDARTGLWRGVAVIETQRAPIIWRPLTTADRAALCASLFVHAWRAKGCRVRAVRPPMGQDFNDVTREALP